MSHNTSMFYFAQGTALVKTSGNTEENDDDEEVVVKKWLTCGPGDRKEMASSDGDFLGRSKKKAAPNPL